MKLREDFLKRYRNKVIWGKFGSKQRVIALNVLVQHYREAFDLVSKYAESDIERDDVLDKGTFSSI